MSIEVLRGGVTAREWSGSGRNVRVSTDDLHYSAFQIRFDMPSKGGGDTDVLVRVTASSFKEIAEAMMVTNPQAAARAFGAALQKIEISKG